MRHAMFETYVTYVSYIMETLLHLLEWLVVRVVEAGSVYHFDHYFSGHRIENRLASGALYRAR